MPSTSKTSLPISIFQLIARGDPPCRDDVRVVPMTRASDETLPANEDLAEVRFRSRQRPQHFNQERHLVDRQTYKERRPAALAEWQTS
jgi:hypothetical protein